jgi:hypothetical protein
MHITLQSKDQTNLRKGTNDINFIDTEKLYLMRH